MPLRFDMMNDAAIEAMGEEILRCFREHKGDDPQDRLSRDLAVAHAEIAKVALHEIVRLADGAPIVDGKQRGSGDLAPLARAICMVSVSPLRNIADHLSDPEERNRFLIFAAKQFIDAIMAPEEEMITADAEVTSTQIN